MKVYLTAKNEQGKKALENLRILKFKTPTILRGIGNYSTEVISEDPYKIQFMQKGFRDIYYSKPVAKGIENAMITIIEECDGNPDDVLIEVK